MFHRRLMFAALAFVAISPALFSMEGPAALSADLATSFQQMPRREWTCTRPPTLVRDGLTSYLEAYVDAARSSITHAELESLYIEIYRSLLATVHSRKIIRPYLASFPLTPETFFVTLFVETDQRKKAVSTASIRHGVLELNIETLFGREVQRKGVEEVKGLRELFSPEVVRCSVGHHISLPFITRLENGESKEKKASFDAAHKLCQLHRLHILTLGNTGSDGSSPKPYQAALFGSAKLTLSKARHLANDCVKEFLRVATRVKPFSCWEKRTDAKEAAGQLLRDIAFRISFWNDDLDRPLAPAIAEIRCNEGACEYFTADDCQGLVKVFSETFWSSPTRDR